MEPAKKLALSVGRLTVYFTLVGAAAGLLSGVMTSSNIRFNLAAPLIALVLFYAAYKLTSHPKLRDRFLMAPVEASEKDKKVNVLMTGFWAYFIIWLIFWMMVYTILVAA